MRRGARGPGGLFGTALKVIHLVFAVCMASVRYPCTARICVAAVGQATRGAQQVGRRRRVILPRRPGVWCCGGAGVMVHLE
jgi:hypothetical protein